MANYTRSKYLDFNLIFKNHPLPMWIYDLETMSFLEVNDAAIKKYGYSRKKFLSMNLKDIRPEYEYKRLIDDIAKIRPSYQESGSWKHKLRNGKIIDVDITSHTLVYNGSNAVLVTAKDITEQKRSEEKIKQLNRVYAVLSDVNQTIVREKNINDLLKKICKIAVSKAGFDLVWIGVMDENKEIVKIISYDGKAKNYLKKLNIDLKDKKLNNGPTGRTVKSGHYTIANDIENDKSMTPWKKNAKRYNLNSSATFPIKLYNNLFGVLNIYSSAKNFFVKEEIELLNEMVMDISFALEFIKEEEKRKQIEENLKLTQFGIDHSQIGIYQIEENGKITYANEYACKSLGYTFNELTKMSVLDIDPTFSFKKWKAHRKNVKTKGAGTIETKHRRKDGTEFDVEVTVNYIDYGGRNVSFSFAKDISERKKSEEELRNSEARMKTLIQTIPDLIWLKDANGKYVTGNSVFEKLLNVKESEFKGKSDYDFWDNKLADFFIERDNIAIEAGKSVSNEELITFKNDGHKELIETIKTPMYDVNGKLVGVLGIGRDITQHKLIEESLRKSQEDLSKFFEDDISADFIASSSGHLINCNNTFIKMFGFESKEQALRYPLEKLYLNPDSRKTFFELLRINKKIENFESEYRALDGKIIFTIENAIAEYDKNGEWTHVRGYIVDITEKKKAEEELRKLSRAVEQGPATVLITDEKGKIEYVNKKFCEVTGYLKEEMIGKNPNVLKSGHHDHEFYKNLWNTILSGKDWNGEILNKKKNGELIWESVLISPLLNKENKITNFVAVKEDITEKKMILEELMKAMEKSESLNKLKDAFIANMSHEIRTPLNGILGLTGIIKDKFAEYIKDDEDELFAGIDHSSKRIIRTVDMILNYSRIQTGEFPINPCEINLLEICDSLIKEFASPAKNKSLSLILKNKCSQKPIILADEYSIVHSISNLIDNAIKYTNEGSIEVVIYNCSNNETCLDIQDTGIGIREEYLKHIFEPYQQEHMGYGRAYEGVGLGLSMVKKFLSLNHALITVNSKKGIGSRFTINFGKIIKQSALKKDDPVNKDFNSDLIIDIKPLILIVEDDTINQITIKRFIQNNFDSVSTDSSDEVIDLLKKQSVDLILMDISIKGSKDGLQLTKEIKSIEEFLHIPVVAITAHAFESDRKNAIDAGCNDYLAKPFSKQQLLDTINKNIKIDFKN